jgi:hypothetical protein
MIIKTQDGLEIELEEYDIRRWFVAVPLEQAQDTFRVVEGIIQMRTEAKPARKPRRDAGVSKTPPLALDLRELNK